tara:strand:+ start:83 stop:820 length:738 start_codon:yes stop_codon:yes gene_type:complete
MNEEKKELAITDDLKPVLSVLKEEDAGAIVELREELGDNWRKKQIFRTETEMRISVLNDAKHPTNASKYWQSVREMGAMFDALMGLSFDLRRNTIDKMRKEQEMKKAIAEDDKFRVMELEIEMDENLFGRANMEKTARDRVRELKLWSQIKSELDDGSFDTEYVNTHQAESYTHNLANRVKSLNSNSQPAEIINAAGPLETVKRLKTKDGKLKQFDGKVSDGMLGAPEHIKLAAKEKEAQLNAEN